RARAPHARERRGGPGRRAGDLPQGPSGARRVSRGRAALHVAVRDRVAPLPEPADRERAPPDPGWGGDAVADHRRAPEARPGARAGRARRSAPPGDRRAARGAPHRRRPARRRGSRLRGDRGRARPARRDRALPAPSRAVRSQGEAGAVLPMTCHDARAQLSALLDDALPLPDRSALEAHLATCADCRRELEQLRGPVTLLARLGPVHAPAGFVDRVMTQAYRPSRRRRLLDALFHPLRVKLPLEAAAVVLVGISALYVYERTPEVRQLARPEAPAPPVALTPPASATIQQ